MSRGKRFRRHVGLPPGTLPDANESDPTHIELIEYGPEVSHRKTLKDFQVLRKGLNDRDTICWVNVDGLRDHDRLRELAAIFQLHPLALEDVWTPQRAKLENYPGHLLMLVQVPRPLPGDISSSGRPRCTLDFEQIAIFFGDGFVLTMQEGLPGDCFDNIRRQLEAPTSAARTRRADYLAYLLLDSIIDSYFPFIECLEDRIDEIEDHVYENAGPGAATAIRQLKRDISDLEKRIRPLSEALTNKERFQQLSFISDDTRIDMRDCLDHARNIHDTLTSQRELASSLMEAYISSMSFATNEVMRALTLITTIFMPLSFLAAVYGMNFDPDKSPYNMPELKARYGYPLCLLAMAIIAYLQQSYFRRRGWLRSANDRAYRFKGWEFKAPGRIPETSMKNLKNE